MKHNLLKSVIISVILLMGVSNAWGVDHTGGDIYFLKPSTWTESKVMMFIGHDSYTAVFEMTKVSNTDNLYHYTMPSWGGATYVAFANDSCVWGTGNWGPSNRTNAKHYTNVYNNYGFNSGSYYVIVPSSTSNNASITINYTGTTASSVNRTTKAIASNKAHGTVSVSGYYLSSATAVSTRSAVSSTASNATASTTLAPASTITFKATANSGYDFIGWYDAESGGNQLSTSTTYTVKYDISFAGKTVYARFEKTYAVTISAGANGTVSPSGSKQVGSTSVTIKATANTGYKFKNWTTTGGVVIANANNATTAITATATGTVKANFEEDLSSNWKLIGDNQTNSPFGDDYTYSNGKAMTKKSGHSTENNVYITLDIKHLPTSYYGFKVATSNSDNDKYGYGTGEGYYITFNRSASNTQKQVYSGSQHELKFIPDALGEYEFRVNYPSNKYVYVTFPTAYTVTFGKGTGGSSVTAKYNSTSFNSGTKVQSGKTVTFTQSASTGYTFKEWNTKADGTGTKLSAEATYTHTVTTSNNVYAVYTQNPDRIIYLEPTGFWDSNNPKYVAHVWGAGEEDITMTGVGEAPYKYYTCDVPAKYTNIVFYRKSTDGSTIWNQTADLTLPNKSTALYTIKSTATPSAGEWKEAYLFYTVTLGSSMFGPYGISYNGQSYFSKDDADVVISLPYGATINFIEGQPYSDIYTGGIMEKGKVRQFDLTQPYTIERDIRFDANYVTKVPQVAYLGVPNSLSGWAETDTRAQYIWRFDSQGEFSMEEVADRGTFEFEVDGVKYYKYTIKAGCNKFQFQHKTKSDSEYNQKTTHYKTNSYLYEVLTTDVNCYMLDGTFSGTTYDGYWCALPAREGDYRLLYIEQKVEEENGHPNTIVTKAHPSDIIRQGDNRTTYSLHIYNKVENDENGMNDPEILVQECTGYDGVDPTWTTRERHMVFGPLHADFGMAAMPGRRDAAGDPAVLRYDNGIENIKNDLKNIQAYNPEDPTTHFYIGKDNPTAEDYQTYIDNFKNDECSGVWNFIVTRDGSNNFTGLDLTETARYTGEYYIRTNAAFGEWNSYKGSDNHMTRSDVSKQHSNYSHYYCKWVKTVGTNVKFTIANDYGMAISDTLTADSTTLWGDLLVNADKMVTGETLPASANVRFSWNEKSNFLHRAYLAGSGEIGNRFLVVKGEDNKILNADGQPLVAAEYNEENPRSNLSNNEEIFNDISNWVYYADVQLEPNAGLKVTAKYNNKVQYFIGQADQYNNTVLAGTGSQKYLIRLLYDFKTNELISAYVPGGQAGKEIEAIETNLMLLRKENETPRQLSFNANNMKDVGKQAYGVLELTKATLIDNTQGKNIYERSLYWISFPFDVRITDIFGFGEYGKHWLIQSYDGAKRAREGLWADSETNWVYHFDPNTLNAGTSDAGIMKKGVGYVVALNLKNIQAESPFVGLITTIALYFPSTTTITGHIVNTDAVSISVPEHECTIIRPTPDGDRHIKDSHWNVIGVPSYINAVGDFSGKISAIAEDVKFYYSWQSDHDKYEVVSGKSGVSFNSLNAYMVQFAGNLQWTNVLNEEAPAGMAAKRNSDNMQEHHLRLELQQNGKEQDRTFIQLQEDEVTTAFDFNYDLCKIINKGANIYSLIATDRDPIEVAGNVLPIEETIIPVGIKLDAAGEYTFAMPEGTDGIVAELIDYEANTTTNLLFSDYTVSLPKGTNETRFALSVRPDKTVTSMENITTPSDSEVRKFIIDGVLYMQKDGVLYDAQGHIVR